MPDHDFDYFVIGGGSAGVRSARIAAQHGARVGIAEERFWGGTCVNVGCVPKKLMVNASEYGAWAEDARGFGWDIEVKGHDWQKLAEGRDREVARLSGIYATLLKGAGVTSFDARATLLDAHTIAMGDQRVTADRILIATGGTASRLDIPGAELALISDDLFTLKALPKKVVVVGAGYIALEFACILRGLGAEVDVVYRAALPLRGFDVDIRGAIVEAMTAQGITMNPDAAPVRIGQAGDGVVLSLSNNFMREADAVFLCTGRSPNTKGLGLEEAGVAVNDQGAVIVDDDHRTSQANIYALGDVIDRLNLTPMATATGHALADTLFGNKPRRASYENVATAVFTTPPIATLGLTEAEAAERGPADIYVTRFTPMRHTISGRQGRKSLMKLVVCQRTRKVLGVHMLGEDAGEILQGIAIAVAMGATKEDFDRTIGIHPTAAEEFVTLRSRTREVGV
ncbi:glutathione-disulfide reductase [Plastoroseomonas arctica]|uniref:Glutathione-disulfide reductase n=1 Tax=Plastoroseomonas arctica TaxID=1509237 RepID=A0AAF1JWF5_9PROT|nr:glutathione-disulfide reductase [Plastoroseomonas arctica]MBR0654692.1 glutathione-disulfide reductase [Plastoroseomonas arctica]